MLVVEVQSSSLWILWRRGVLRRVSSSINSQGFSHSLSVVRAKGTAGPIVVVDSGELIINGSGVRTQFGPVLKKVCPILEEICPVLKGVC